MRRTRDKIALITGISAGDGADAAITRLLSDESAWITGQVLGVDGRFASVRPMVRPQAATST